MKRSVLTRNGITPATVKVLSRLVAMIPWPDRRQAMGEMTLSLRGQASRGRGGVWVEVTRCRWGGTNDKRGSPV